MARGVNKVILIGNLGKDPEVTYTGSGTAIAKFTLATTESRKINDEWQDHTEWHRVVCFGKTAETAGQYLNKGRQVYIEGKLSYGSYEKEGVTHYTTDIIVNNLQFLGSKGDSGGGGGQPRQQYQPDNKNAPEEDIEDDLPF